MWNKCNVVMLSANTTSNIQLLMDNKLHYENGNSVALRSYQHLYITSDKDDEEIKERDYCIDSGELFGPYERVDILIKPSYKIIASTDPSLGLPLIPQQFINAFIEQYNEGNVIKETLVEYKEYEKDEEWSELRLKVNPDGVINIKFPKDNFSREEVIELLHKYESDMTYFGRDSYYKGCFPEVTDDWANENL